MSRYRTSLAAVFLVSSFLAAGCDRFSKDKYGNTRGKDAPVSVTVEPVVLRSVQRSIDAVGTLHGYEEVVVSAKVGGRVRRILHDVGDRVSAGEVLLEIDPTDYELSARQAEKALNVELARLGLNSPPTEGFDVMDLPTVVQARARLDNAKHHLENTRSLMERKAVSSDEFADRQFTERVAKAVFDGELLSARASLAVVQMRQEDLAIARQQLADTLVRVPVPTHALPDQQAGSFDYAVTARQVSEGTFVAPGSPVFRLVIDDWLKLRVPIPERHGSEVKLDQKVNIQSSGSDLTFVGTVTRINPAVDTTTRTFEIEISVRNGDRRLKSGSFAKAAILTRIDADAVTVPLESLVSFAGVTKIFVVENGRARAVQVEPAYQTNAWVEVVGGHLPAGAQVVTSGQSALSEGREVKLRGPEETIKSSTDSRSTPRTAFAEALRETAR